MGDLSAPADNGGYTYTMALSESAPVHSAGCWTGTYDDGSTQYAYSTDGTVWNDVNGNVISDTVSKITTDQRGYYRY